MLTGHTSSLVTLWRGHLCRTCSVVWSSWPQGQVGEGASFSLRCIWLFSLLCPVRSLTRTTCCFRNSRWFSSLCGLGIVNTLMRVVFSLKLTLLACCSPLALSFARMSPCSFPDIPQWAGTKELGNSGMVLIMRIIMMIMVDDHDDMAMHILCLCWLLQHQGMKDGMHLIRNIWLILLRVDDGPRPNRIGSPSTLNSQQLNFGLAFRFPPVLFCLPLFSVPIVNLLFSAHSPGFFSIIFLHQCHCLKSECDYLYSGLTVSCVQKSHQYGDLCLLYSRCNGSCWSWMELSVTGHLSLSSLHLSGSLADCWGTTVHFTTSFLHSSRFSAFRSMIFHSVPVHSLMLSSHRFLCLPLRLPLWTVPCRIVLASPDDHVTCPYHFSLHLFTEVRRSSYGLTAFPILGHLYRLLTLDVLYHTTHHTTPHHTPYHSTVCTIHWLHHTTPHHTTLHTAPLHTTPHITPHHTLQHTPHTAPHTTPHCTQHHTTHRTTHHTTPHHTTPHKL